MRAARRARGRTAALARNVAAPIGSSRVYRAGERPVPWRRCGSPSSRRTRGAIPGGVTRHIEALADAVRCRAATSRGSSRRSTPMTGSARGCTAACARRRASTPANVVSLGRTIGLRANGAVSNVALMPSAGGAAAPRAARRRLRRRPHPRADRAGDRAGTRSASAACRWSAPFTPTRPTALTNGLGQPRRGQAALQPPGACGSPSPRAAAWTGERFFGGHYRVIPNGVEVPERLDRAPAALPTRGAPAAAGVRRPGGRAQGPAGRAAGVRGAARARPVQPRGHRRRARAARDDAASTRAASPRSASSTTSARPRCWRAPTC